MPQTPSIRLLSPQSGRLKYDNNPLTEQQSSKTVTPTACPDFMTQKYCDSPLNPGWLQSMGGEFTSSCIKHQYHRDSRAFRADELPIYLPETAGIHIDKKHPRIESRIPNRKQPQWPEPPVQTTRHISYFRQHFFPNARVDIVVDYK